MIKLFKMAIIITLFMFSACAVTQPLAVKTHNLLKQKKTSKKINEAEHYFDLGKACYNQGYFKESISYLVKSVNGLDSNKKKAELYIFIGADYFYLDEIQCSKKYFKKSKQFYSKIYPDKKQFPAEIRKLFYSVK